MPIRSLRRASLRHMLISSSVLLVGLALDRGRTCAGRGVAHQADQDRGHLSAGRRARHAGARAGRQVGRRWASRSRWTTSPAPAATSAPTSWPRAPGDGATLVIGTVGTHAINASLYDKMPYNHIKDFTPITFLASTPNLLVVNKNVPANNVKELIELAKKQPLSFGSSGSGTSIHLSGELFNTLAGVKMQHIPYKGRAAGHPRPAGRAHPA